MGNINIFPSYKCNLDCLFCAGGGKEGSKDVRDLTTCEIIEKLDEVVDSNSMVAFSGGEPTLRADLIYLVRYASNKGATILLTTNATKLSNFNLALELVDAGVNIFSITLRGHNAKFHDYLTQTKGSFDRTFAAFKNLSCLRDDYGYHFDIQLKILVTKPIVRHMPQIIELISREFPKPYIIEITGIAIVSNAKRNINEIAIKLTDAAPYVRKTIDVGKQYDQTMRVMDIPPCILGDPNYFEYYRPWDNPHHYDTVDEQYASVNLECKEPELVKGNLCRDCIMYNKCTGVTQSYAEIFGFDELKPIINQNE